MWSSWVGAATAVVPAFPIEVACERAVSSMNIIRNDNGSEMAVALLSRAESRSTSSRVVPVRLMWDLFWFRTQPQVATCATRDVESAWASRNETQLSLVVLSLFATCGDQGIHKIVKDDCEHLKTCMAFVKEQIEAARYFLFELPWNAWSWQMHDRCRRTRGGSPVCRRRHVSLRPAGGEHRW